MKSADFVALHRPRLGTIKHFPVVEFADYERRLASMQERVKISGGDFSIRSAQQIGTVVRATWPVGGTSESPE